MHDATFLFTDIEGSTRLWEEQPERMRPALAAHDALLREVVERHRGRVVKMTGDGVHAVFEDALDALHATIAALRDMPGVAPDIELRVRCGLHSGPSERRDGDYFGGVVNRAARVMSAAHGGQALLSEAVVQRLEGRMPDQASLRDLGSARLRDLARPERLYQLAYPGLRESFPALRSLEDAPNNLPLQLSSFVGREREIAHLRASVASHRLVTVIGMGGLGKTRLALHAAADGMEDFADGAWLVELAGIDEPRWVPQAIASTLGLKQDPGASLEDSLARHLRDRRLLLILDNCEHVLESTALIARKLLSGCANLRILATSREPLRLAGETLFPLAGLAVPGPREALSVAAMAPYESVRLFVERAVAASPGFVLDEENAAAIAAICHRLDGIPLAIELAAARVRAVSLAQIADRLKDRFRLLKSGDPTALPRQRTLRATIDWSYELLPEAERTLFRRLAVFAGGFTVEAVEAACAGDSVEAEAVLDLCASLVEKSLIGAREGGARYEMLETVREYARERLEGLGETAAVRVRHLEYYARLCQEAKKGLAGHEASRWLSRLDLERENLFAAHATAGLSPTLADAGLILLNGSKFFWLMGGLSQAGERLFAEALARPGASPSLRAQALFHAGQIGYFRGDYAAARARLTESLAAARALGDDRGVGAVLQPLAMTATAQGDYGWAEELLSESIRYCRAAGEVLPLAGALTALALLRRAEKRVEVARTLYEEVLELLSREENDEARARTLVNLAIVALEQGEAGRAADLVRQGLALASATGSVPATHSALEVCAALASVHRDARACATFLRAAAKSAEQTGLRQDPVDADFLRRHVEIALLDRASETTELPARDEIVADVSRQALEWLQARRLEAALTNR